MSVSVHGMTQSIPAYRLKVERAKRHIQELAAEVEAFHASKPYEVIIQDDPATSQRLYKVKINRCVPVEWSGIVGDAIHNARSSLDLLMVALVRHCDPNRASYNHVKFIVGETKQAFESRLRDSIKGASSEARRLVENLKPYKGGEEAFWRLHQLDILDKHKAIIPVGAAHRGVAFTIDCAGMLNHAFGGDRAPLKMSVELTESPREFPLKDGTILYGEPLDHERLPYEDEPQFNFEVAFGEGQIIDGEPLIPALTQICQFVEVVFDVFETGLSGFKK
jgi:hypothetical protein